jgi:N-acetylmuramoyl-L-alanine amidase
MPTNSHAPSTRGATPDEIEAGNHRRDTWVPLQEWTRSKGLAAPAQLSAGPSASYAIKSTNGVMVLSVGSMIAHWDGLELRLGFAPQLINGQLYVHGLDLRKTLQPLLQGAAAGRLGPGSIIVIDPGHGGTDAGTRSVVHNRYEKEFTLDWAYRLQALLAARGCRVFLTRSSDMDLALSNRVAFAAQHNADLFLSLHFNSVGQNPYEAGLETYCLTPTGMPSSITRGFADELWLTFPNNAFDAQNLRLAVSVHRSLLRVNGQLDRGIRRARFPAVLRGQARPAILIEGGYLSNPREAGLIAEPAYRQRLAEAVARALLPAGESMGEISKSTETQQSAERADVKSSSTVEQGPVGTHEPVGVGNDQLP